MNTLLPSHCRARSAESSASPRLAYIPTWLDRRGAPARRTRPIRGCSSSAAATRPELRGAIPSDDYPRSRPELLLTGTSSQYHGDIGAPSLAPLKSLYDHGKAAIIRASAILTQTLAFLSCISAHLSDAENTKSSAGSAAICTTSAKAPTRRRAVRVRLGDAAGLSITRAAWHPSPRRKASLAPRPRATRRQAEMAATAR